MSEGVSVEAVEAVKTMTCLVTIVEPGMPDKVIKITPALHAKEKIWLDNTPGIERWAAVQQLMERFCPRGKYVPKPAYLREPGINPKDAGPALPEAAYPTCILDGAVFEPLVNPERMKRPKPAEVASAQTQELALVKAKNEVLESKLELINSKFEQVLGALASLQQRQAQPVAAVVSEPVETEAVKRGAGRPRKA